MAHSVNGAPLKENIELFLNDNDYNFIILNTIDSTSSYLRKLAEDGAVENTVVIANEQTQGRGRRGKSFFSPADKGIYMSILLKPQIAMNKAIYLTTCAAVAVAKAIEKVFNISVGIKWVNDVYINYKKVCGILTEGISEVDSSELKYVILGIGVNVSKTKFPDEIKDIAASISDTEQNISFKRDELIAEILNYLSDSCKKLESREIYEEYKSRMFLINKNITVLSSIEYRARVLDVLEDFSLLIERENGEQECLSSGEVSTKLC